VTPAVLTFLAGGQAAALVRLSAQVPNERPDASSEMHSWLVRKNDTGLFETRG
jgi:hypothetical protein